MDLIPLISTVAGAVIAIAGTVIADLLRRRDSRHRYSYTERQRSYVEIMLALGATLEGLREVSGSTIAPERLTTATTAVMSKAGIYVAREKLLMIGAPKVAQAGEAAFNALVGLRDAVRAGARVRTPEFHAAYHPYADEVWRLRMAIRDDLGAEHLSASELNRDGWDSRANCETCNQHNHAGVPV